MPDDEKNDQQYAPHQQRVVQELSELSDKLAKLKTFTTGTTFSSLAADEQERLKRQLGHMEGYVTVLVERIAAF
jgi:histone acetyltransferase (RNA polymerase elongator complex component)